MTKLKIFFFLLLANISISWSTETNISKQEADAIKLSLLTCDAGNPIYTLFGHTAIRYENPSKGIDAVFNYGLFRFNTPNFIWRFSLGETDYELGIESYERFKWEYDYFGRDVWQQTLNLNNDEKIKLIELLEENCKPENRVYRYNFFFDNCATRPRDKIEESIHGEIMYPNFDQDNIPKTFRDVIYQNTNNHPWSRFGMDFCVGSEADQPITNRQLMFAPFYLKNAFEKAQIINKETKRNLIIETIKVVDANGTPDELSNLEKIGEILTPLRSALLLFIIVASLSIYGIKYQKGLWWLDLILFGAAGLAGCVITFLALFSEHPAVSANFLLFVFHPGQLLFLPFVIYRIRKRERSWYMMFNLVVLTLFIALFAFIPQRINFAVVPLALCLLLRSLSNLLLTYKKDR